MLGQQGSTSTSILIYQWNRFVSDVSCQRISKPPLPPLIHFGALRIAPSHCQTPIKWLAIAIKSTCQNTHSINQIERATSNSMFFVWRKNLPCDRSLLLRLILPRFLLLDHSKLIWGIFTLCELELGPHLDGSIELEHKCVPCLRAIVDSG